MNVWWDRSAAPDFGHYNVYLSQAEISDVSGMKAVQQIRDVDAFRYQLTGLEDGKRYYIAVTAVDKSGDEGVRVASVSATPMPMPRGTSDSSLVVDIHQPDRVWAGTTFLPITGNDPPRRRIVEVNMLGEVVWEYTVPQMGAMEAELLPNNNILYTVSGNGVYEIDRSGRIVWSYRTSKVDHDADRLPNGNTIFVSAEDQKSDAQVKEVNPAGQVVWSWYAKDHFDKPPYSEVRGLEGHWTHTNAVTRLPNGNTLISPRDFNMLVEVDPAGKVVGTYGEGILMEPHDPEVLPNGNILAASHNIPQRAVEIDPKTNKVVWQYAGFGPDDRPVRDANRLPNGNTLITASKRIVEVTPEGRIVWQLALKETTSPLRPAGGFYKADRISAQK